MAFFRRYVRTKSNKVYVLLLSLSVRAAAAVAFIAFNRIKLVDLLRYSVFAFLAEAAEPSG